MDIFCEHIVKRRKQTVDFVVESILILIAVYMSYIALAMAMVLQSFTLLVVVGIWYGAIYLIRRKDIEYEYTLTNSTLDIDRIFAKRSRKRVTSIDIAGIDYIRPIEDSDYEKNPTFSDHNLCECKESKDTYVLVFPRDGRLHRIFFTPNNKMKLKMKKVNPARVTVIAEEEEEE